MRHGLVLLMLFALPCWSQTAQTARAETSGFCSPAVSGNNNQFTITCQNIPDKLRIQLVDLLNRVAKNQADADAMLGKLDGCLESIKEVREQQLPWNLTSDQKVELKGLLRGSKAKFKVDAILQDRNASLMGTDLFLVLKDSGWEPGNTRLTINADLNFALFGVIVAVSHKDFPEALQLYSALQAIGVKVEFNDHTGLWIDKDTVWVIVGAKPVPNR